MTKFRQEAMWCSNCKYEPIKTALYGIRIRLGFGLKITRFRLDFAFTSWSFAGLHQFTVQTRL